MGVDLRRETNKYTMVKSTKTTDRKTRTSVSLGNDYFPKRTTYQSTYMQEGAVKVQRSQGHELAEVLPSQVYPPPFEPLRRTIYREDFGRMSNKQTASSFRRNRENAYHQRYSRTAGRAAGAA